MCLSLGANSVNAECPSGIGYDYSRSPPVFRIVLMSKGGLILASALNELTGEGNRSQIGKRESFLWRRRRGCKSYNPCKLKKGC